MPAQFNDSIRFTGLHDSGTAESRGVDEDKMRMILSINSACGHPPKAEPGYKSVPSAYAVFGALANSRELHDCCSHLVSLRNRPCRIHL